MTSLTQPRGSRVQLGIRLALAVSRTGTASLRERLVVGRPIRLDHLERRGAGVLEHEAVVPRRAGEDVPGRPLVRAAVALVLLLDLQRVGERSAIHADRAAIVRPRS